MIAKPTNRTRITVLERDMRELHARFLKLYEELQRGNERGTLRSFADDPAAFCMFQGMTQALIAMFRALGRNAGDDRDGGDMVLRQLIDIPKEDPMRRYLADVVGILSEAAEILGDVVNTAPPVEKHDLPTVSGRRSIRPSSIAPRSQPRRSKPPENSIDLPVYKHDGAYREILRIVGDLPTQYCIVSPRRTAPRRKSG